MRPSRERIVAAIVIAVAALLGFAARGAAQGAAIQPPADVPGVVNPAVTQDNIGATICVRGWSAKQRPPTSYTEPLKLRLLKASGYADQNPQDYELDHRISLENGGSPTDPANLWVEPYLGKCNARDKDRLENRLHALACTGKITLAEDQAALTGDWTEAYRRYVGSLDCE